MQQRTFHAMGTDIELFVEADRADNALAAAEAEFHRLEALLSRFRPESELSRLNATGGGDVRVTVVTADAVAAEVWAKALFLVSAERAIDEANVRGIPCVVVPRNGPVRLAGGLA